MHNFTWRFKEMMLDCDNAVVSAVSSLCFNDFFVLFFGVCVYACFCLFLSSAVVVVFLDMDLWSDANK